MFDIQTVYFIYDVWMTYEWRIYCRLSVAENHKEKKNFEKIETYYRNCKNMITNGEY